MEFFDALVRYEVVLWNTVEEQLRRQDQIGLATLHALRVLARHDDQARVQDLSDDIGITVGAASKLVDRLERDGLAVRRPNPANRRSSLLALTPPGDRALATASEVCRAALARAVGPEDVDVLTAALRRLQARLDSGTGVAA